MKIMTIINVIMTMLWILAKMMIEWDNGSSNDNSDHSTSEELE